MKKKDMWMVIAVISILGVGYLAMGGGLGGLGAGTPGTPVVVSENKASLSVACYDGDNGLDNGKVGAQIEVSKNGMVVYPLTNAATGTLSLDENQGYRAGDAVVVRCINNSDTGYYENRVAATLTAGSNGVAVPVKKVGTANPAVTSQSITIGSAGSSSVEYDLYTTVQRQYLHKPILFIADHATNSNRAIASGNITSISCSGGQQVPCDTDAISGSGFCCQLDKEFVSTSDGVSKGKIFLFAGSAADPIGNVTVTIYDGVPFDTTPGKASINRANAYDTTNTALTAYVIIA